MSDQVRDPLFTALALCRAQMMHLRGETNTQDVIEAIALEMLASEDLVALARAQALLSASLVGLAVGLSVGKLTGDQLLDVVEESVRTGDESGR